MQQKEKYKDLEKFSKATGIPEDNLTLGYEIERKFHEDILKESSFEKRRSMYNELYPKVLPLFHVKGNDDGSSFKDKVAMLFKKEVENKSVLDVGCGEGLFLKSIARLVKYKKLAGVDIAAPESHPDINFIVANIIDFQTDEKYDVVVSDQVLEHIAPADLDQYISSVYNSLKNGGTLIINLPHKEFGPSDVTRIIDYSYSGKVQAHCSHLNESNYSEVVKLLKENNFTSFKTIFPVSKLKYFPLLRDIRFSTSIMEFIEKRPFLLNMIKAIRVKGQCVLRFEVTIICKKI